MLNTLNIEAERRASCYELVEAERGHMEYKFIPDLAAEFAMPQDGILSRVLHKDEKLNVTLFGFSTGQELSTHSAPTPALLYFLQGEADLRLGSDMVHAKAGSFVYMPPTLPHGISAKTPVMMLLVQVKEPRVDTAHAAQGSEIVASS